MMDESDVPVPKGWDGSGRALLLKALLPEIPNHNPDLKRESNSSLCGPCPFCGGVDRFVYKTAENRWFCRKCTEKGGDVIDYYKKIYSTDFNGLCAEYIAVGTSSPPILSKKKTEGGVRKKLPPESIESQWSRLQVIGKGSAELKVYADNRGIPVEAFLNRTADDCIRKCEYGGKDSLAFLFRSLSDSSCCAIQYATVSEEPFGGSYSKKRIIGKGHSPSLGFFILRRERLKNASRVILVESVLNVIAGTLVLPDACWIALNGSNISNLQVEQLKSSLAAKRLIVFGDNDDAGRTLAKKVSDAFHSEVNTVMWDYGSSVGADVNDLYREGRINTIVRMVEEATQCRAKLEKNLNVVSIGHLLQMKLKEPDLLLGPWLLSQGLCLVHAYRGVGKTHFSLGVGIAVATGGKFLNFKADKPHGVLFVDGEMPVSLIKKRIASAVRDSQKMDNIVFNLLTPDLQEFGMPDLATIEGQKRIAPFINDSIDLIILDNLSTLCGSMNENKGDSWLHIQEWILRLRASGKSVLMVHHDGKSGDQRGTSRKEDILDTVIQLRRPPQYEIQNGAVFEVHFMKARGLCGDSVKPFEAELELSDDGKQIWKTRDRQDSLAEKVGAMLNDGCQQKDIAEELSISRGYVSKIVAKIKQQPAKQ